jgi:DNA-directed RNA polymerase subunit RPC12/RpoP
MAGPPDPPYLGLHMRLRCTDCGSEFYSAVAEFLIREGIRCDSCDGELELIARREALPSGRRQSRFSRSLLKDDVDAKPDACGSSGRAV